MAISYSKLFVGISLPALCTGLASLLLSISADAQTIRPTTQKELKVFDPTTGNSGNIGIRAAAGTLSYTLTLPAAAPSANQVLTANAVTGGNVTLTWATPVSGTVTSVGLSTGTTGTDVNVSGSPITSSGTITLNIPTASANNTGKLSSTDWSTFNNKQNTISLTTNLTSGAATLSGTTLNIPQYQAALTNPVTGTGTLNYLSKFATAGTLTNSLIFDNGTNIGVGTATPSITTRFEIRGAGATSATTALEVDNSLGNPLLVVKNDGSVGIGTTSPRSPLEIQEDNSSLFRMVRPASPPRTITDYGFEGGNGGIGLYDYTNSDYSWWVSPTGNVGIGTASPALKLHISGTTGYPATSGTTQTGIARFESISNSNVLDIGQGNSGAYGLWLQGTGRGNLSLAYPILLNPNGGNVGIGTTSPGFKLQTDLVDDFTYTGQETTRALPSGVVALFKNNTTTSGTFGGIGLQTRNDRQAYIGAIDEGGTFTPAIVFGQRTGSTTFAERMRIDLNGNVGIGTTTNLSRARLNLENVASGANQAIFGIESTLANTSTSTSSTSHRYAIRGNYNKTGSSADIGFQHGSAWFESSVESGSTTNLANVNSRIGIKSGATITNAYDFVADRQFQSPTGSATTRAGLYVRDWAATATNQYGVYIEDLTSGTASNYALYSAGANDLSYFAGNVGIGTTNPGSQLTIVSPYTAANGSANPIFSISGNNNNNSSFVGGARISPTIGTLGTENLNLTAVEISPTFFANNSTTISNAYSLRVSATKGGGQTLANAYSLYVDAPTGATNNYAAYFGGNVGIGTTSPTLGRLQVSGSITMTDDQSSFLYLPRFSSQDNKSYIVAGDSDRNYPVGMELRVRSSGGSPMTVMNFDGTTGSGNISYGLNMATVGGNVGIGTTTPGSDKLQINESTNADISVSLIARGGNSKRAQLNFAVKNSSATNVGGSIGSSGARDGGLVLQGNTDSITANNAHFFISAGGETRLRASSSTLDQGDYNLQVNGTGVWAAGAYFNGSDSTLKKNIKLFPSSTEALKKLRPVTYNYKSSYNKDTTIQAGFIAQEVQEALKSTDYVDGVVKKGSFLSIAYQSLIPLLTKALQESIDRIELLEKKISILEQKASKN